MKKGFFDKLLLEYSNVVNETNEAEKNDDDDEEKKKGFFSRILSAITSDKKEEEEIKREELSGGSEKENSQRKNSKESVGKRKSIDRNDKNRLSSQKSNDRSLSPQPDKNLSPKSCLEKKEAPSEKSKDVIKSSYVEEKLEKLDLKEVSEIKIPHEINKAPSNKV